MHPEAEDNSVFSSTVQRNLVGKVAVVTGASRGIGRAVALRLAMGGANLVLTARSEEALQATSEQIRNYGSDAIVVATPDGAPDRVVSAAIEAFGGLDILVNNAGTTKRGDFTVLTDDDWVDGYRTKLFGTVYLCRAAWPELKRRRGSVINIAGAGGRTPDHQFTIGGSVNAAVMAFTKALADLGIEDGVQVNAINPGLIRTDRTISRLKEYMNRLSISAEEAEQKMAAQFKIARLGEPEEIAELIAYIITGPGRLLHGSIIDADAGYTKGL